MRNYLLFSAILCTIAFGAISASAQCNPTYESPIKCSYYDEGYRDGAGDANNNYSNDYRRYKNKYTKQYENYYRNGYQAGYGSVYQGGGGGNSWTNSQRTAYDSGYTVGQLDRTRPVQNRSSQNQGNYDANIGLYFQAGYNDGFNGVARRYNFPIGDNGGGWGGGGGGGGGAAGTGSWSGRVDDRANIIIRGNSITSQDVSGTGLTIRNQYLNGTLPFRASTVTVTRRQGRGGVNVIQQPNRFNNFTAIIQINDTKGGSGDYQVDIRWTGSANVEEPYQSGSVYWRGRVDQKANIVINGSDVQSQDDSATGLTNVNFNINGYLAHRPGTVNVRKRNGRGSVYVLQQPSWQNDFTAIIQVFDPSGGSDDYEVDVSW